MAGKRMVPEWYFMTHVGMNLTRYLAQETKLSGLNAGSKEFESAADILIADAMNAALPAYHLADHMFIEYARSRPEVVYRISALKRYRAYLDEFRCVDTVSGETRADLALLGAVVDTYKHAEVTKTARPASAPRAFVRIRKLPDETVWRVVVIQDGKPMRSFTGIIENVVAMWLKELTTHGLLESISKWESIGKWGI